MTLLSRRLFLKLSASAAIAGNVQANDGRHKTGLVIDDRFLAHKISDTHPESPARYRAVKSHLLAENFHKKLTLIKPKADADSWLSKVHSIDHINEIKSNQPATYKNALLATAGVLAAIDSVCTGEVNNAFCASRPPGHHAKNTGQEAGFCYFNHVAIGARYAQEHYQLNKILIIDWDYHHGNGTEWAFYSDPTVLYFSTHDMFDRGGSVMITSGFPFSFRKSSLSRSLMSPEWNVALSISLSAAFSFAFSILSGMYSNPTTFLADLAR